jgi:hypothetical protein
MRGLDPRIHQAKRSFMMDCRVKLGNDKREIPKNKSAAPGGPPIVSIDRSCD